MPPRSGPRQILSGVPPVTVIRSPDPGPRNPVSLPWRTKEPGGTAAPGVIPLSLLPSGPDEVRGRRRAGPGLLASHDYARATLRIAQSAFDRPELWGSSPLLETGQSALERRVDTGSGYPLAAYLGRDCGSAVMPLSTASHSLHPAPSAPGHRRTARVAPTTRPPRDRTRPARAPPTQPPSRLLTRPLRLEARRACNKAAQVPVKRACTNRGGGEGGIRTRGTVARTHAFQACSFGHSDTSPHGPWKPLAATSQRAGGEGGI